MILQTQLRLIHGIGSRRLLCAIGQTPDVGLCVLWVSLKALVFNNGVPVRRSWHVAPALSSGLLDYRLIASSEPALLNAPIQNMQAQKKYCLFGILCII